MFRRQRGRPTALNNDLLRESAVWIPRGEEPPVQPKANLHEKKCLLSCFWDAKGMLYYELLRQGRTVNATTYFNQLASLALALREKRQRRSAVPLIHDNVRPQGHSGKTTRAELGHGSASTVLTRHRALCSTSSTRSPPRSGRRTSTTSPSDSSQL
uniref:Uncharacterized protein n=1 Tax=Caenorhabditis japonica TaxID=281687 RepID=A0A8R1ITS2_CAEJA